MQGNTSEVSHASFFLPWISLVVVENRHLKQQKFNGSKPLMSFAVYTSPCLVESFVVKYRYRRQGDTNKCQAIAGVSALRSTIRYFTSLLMVAAGPSAANGRSS